MLNFARSLIVGFWNTAAERLDVFNISVSGNLCQSIIATFGTIHVVNLWDICYGYSIIADG